jgi:hypothetical protein
VPLFRLLPVYWHRRPSTGREVAQPACQPVIGMNEEIIFPDREFVRFRDNPAAEAMIDDE